MIYDYELGQLLTRRELEIFSCLLDGNSNQQIADKMFITINTVRTHTKSIYGKLGLRNRIELLTRYRH